MAVSPMTCPKASAITRDHIEALAAAAEELVRETKSHSNPVNQADAQKVLILAKDNLAALTRMLKGPTEPDDLRDKMGAVTAAYGNHNSLVREYERKVRDVEGHVPDAPPIETGPPDSVAVTDPASFRKLVSADGVEESNLFDDLIKVMKKKENYLRDNSTYPPTFSPRFQSHVTKFIAGKTWKARVMKGNGRGWHLHFDVLYKSDGKLTLKLLKAVKEP